MHVRKFRLSLLIQSTHVAKKLPFPGNDKLKFPEDQSERKRRRKNTKNYKEFFAVGLENEYYRNR